MNCSMPGLLVYHHLLEFTQTHVHWVSDAIQPSHPLSSPSPPAPNPSQDQSLFQWVNSSHEVARVLEFQLSHHSFQRNPGVISFRMDWLDLLAVQGTLKSLLQYHSSKAACYQCDFQRLVFSVGLGLLTCKMETIIATASVRTHCWGHQYHSKPFCFCHKTFFFLSEIYVFNSWAFPDGL